MLDDKKVLAVIPARGGSKGLPRKNVLPLAGRPLICWSIAHAEQSRLVDRTIVSTDDEEIAQVARKHGGDVPFLRPAELATDTATTLDVMLDLVEQMPEFDIFVVLQPTNPFRRAADIDDALAFMAKHKAPSVVSVTTPEKSPFWSFVLDKSCHMIPLLGLENSRKRRQELPRAVTLNGVIYAFEKERFLHTGQMVDEQTVAFEMPKCRSLDIDTQQDMDIAEYLVSREEIV